MDSVATVDDYPIPPGQTQLGAARRFVPADLFRAMAVAPRLSEDMIDAGSRAAR
jgi:hypothetical protein